MATFEGIPHLRCEVEAGGEAVGRLASGYSLVLLPEGFARRKSRTMVIDIVKGAMAV